MSPKNETKKADGSLVRSASLINLMDASMKLNDDLVDVSEQKIGHAVSNGMANNDQDKILQSSMFNKSRCQIFGYFYTFLYL